jgi:uncharacterized protein YecT (DUF1311 family)
MKRFFAIGVVLLVVIGIARSAGSLDCDNANTTVDMKQCAQIEYDKADKELNDAYKKVMTAVKASGNPKAKDKLVAAQRAWIDFRDKDCAFEASVFEGGTIYGLIYTGCLTTRTQTRTQELLSFVDMWK